MKQHIPARGRKHMLPECIERYILKQHIPARGRKPEGNVVREIVFRETTYPRKGTETCNPWYSYNHKPETTYPRKGTETSKGMAYSHSSEETTYPRKGTETCGTTGPAQPTRRNNISPQGDGNTPIQHHHLVKPTKQHIPARGRKLFQVFHDDYSF